jgi:Na+-driven multidrug efflux pump
MSIRKKISIFVAFSLFFLSMANSINAQWTVFELPDAEIGDIVSNLALWLVSLFVFFGVIGFIVSGIMYLVSTGNEEVITKAKKYMTYSIVGVIVGLSGYVIIQAVDLMLHASSMFF